MKAPAPSREQAETTASKLPVRPDAKGRIYLIDTMSFIFRAYHAMARQRQMSTKTGVPTSATFVFTNMLLKLVKDFAPEYRAAVFDVAAPTFRDQQAAQMSAVGKFDLKTQTFQQQEYKGYKAQRAEMPADLAQQIPHIRRLLEAYRIPILEMPGYEADDVIGTLAATERTDPVLAVSGDRDLMQIVRDEPVPVRLLYVGRGLAKAEHLGPAEVAEKYGVPRARAGEAYAEMAMLRGDPSDGLPGVPGVGAKTAATLVGRFGSWLELCEAVIDRSDTRLAPPVRAKLAAAAPYLAVVEPVVRVAVDAPVRLDRPDALPSTPADPDRLAALSERWGLSGSVDRLVKALESS